MSTRSAIIQQQDDGSYRGIYCHFDGYPTGVGKVLLEHYQDPGKVSALIALGDISSLGSSTDYVGGNGTVAYMRDRGETECEPKVGATSSAVAEFIGHNGYVYVFSGGGWTCNGKPISDAIAADENGDDVRTNSE
jgi:hypothetical protein